MERVGRGPRAQEFIKEAGRPFSAGAPPGTLEWQGLGGSEQEEKRSLGLTLSMPGLGFGGCCGQQQQQPPKWSAGAWTRGHSVVTARPFTLHVSGVLKASQSSMWRESEGPGK